MRGAMLRPPFIVHWKDIVSKDDSHYPDSDELHSIGSPLGTATGLERLGVHHELLPPGRRTSFPHAEKDEEELVFVLDGVPDVWIDGDRHRLAPGECVGFSAGTWIAQTFINDTEEDVRLPRRRRTHPRRRRPLSASSCARRRQRRQAMAGPAAAASGPARWSTAGAS